MSVEDDDVDATRLSLDALLRQVVHRADDVRAAHRRLRGLLAATESLLGAAELSVALRRIADAAVQLTSAGYAAVVILTSSGSEIDEVITAVGAQPRPLPVPPDPAGPGVFIAPLHVRTGLFGYLVVADGPADGFGADDEELVTALAATAGIVLDNAQLFEQARRRQRWLAASASVTRRLLEVAGEDALALIAREARELGDADVSAVLLRADDGKRLVVEVASGTGAATLRGLSFDPDSTLSGRALAEQRAVLVADVPSELPGAAALLGQLAVGPAMALPLSGTEGLLGTLVIARIRGRRPFDDSDLEMASAFANHAAVALELAAARADQQRVAVLEDRDRIARSLHDQVIQRLFAAGLSLQGIAGAVPAADDVAGHQQRLRRVVSDIDETIRQIRSSVFELSETSAAGSARGRLLAVIADVGRVLPAEVNVQVDEGVDLIDSDSLVSDAAAVLREGLTNVARHAAATVVDVQVRSSGGTLSVEISDDGIGIGASDRRSGLDNLRQRALARGGSLRLEPAPAYLRSGRDRPGTRICWTAPLG